ncbi:MAG: hypothetical protein K8S27_11575 [Candidatus Omnitrophica bacterium]|nr:hypothetical protein [Candidatus Omnitrophota bacterium]
MNRITKRMKKNKDVIEELVGREILEEKIADMMVTGKKALDGAILKIGRLFVETLLIMDREEKLFP